MSPITRLRLVPALALAALSLALPAFAQAPAAKPTGAIATHPDWPKAAPADVKSVESIINAVYNVISGPKGQARNWKRMRTLFVPGARLAPIREEGAHADVTLLDIDGYIERASKRMEADGFFEKTIANRVEVYGNLVEVWSTYESRHGLSDPSPSLAASTASSSSRTATATGSCRSCGMRRRRLRQSRRST